MRGHAGGRRGRRGPGWLPAARPGWLAGSAGVAHARWDCGDRAPAQMGLLAGAPVRVPGQTTRTGARPGPVRTGPGPCTRRDPVPMPAQTGKCSLTLFSTPVASLF